MKEINTYLKTSTSRMNAVPELPDTVYLYICSHKVLKTPNAINIKKFFIQALKKNFLRVFHDIWWYIFFRFCHILSFFVKQDTTNPKVYVICKFIYFTSCALFTTIVDFNWNHIKVFSILYDDIYVYYITHFLELKKKKLKF